MCDGYISPPPPPPPPITQLPAQLLIQANSMGMLERNSLALLLKARDLSSVSLLPEEPPLR